MRILLTPKRLGSHGETPHPHSSPRVLGDEKVTGSDEEKDNLVPSKKSKVNADDERTNQNRDSDRDDPPPADPKSILGDIFSPMKSITSVDDTTTFTDVDIDAVLTKSPGLEKTSPTANEETNRLNFRHLWAEKKLAHSSASKECDKLYRDDAREGVMDGPDEEEDETSIAHVLAGWRQEEKKEDHKSYRGGNFKAHPQLGITPRPVKDSAWSHSIHGTKIYDPRGSWESDDLPTLQPAPEAHILRVLDISRKVVKGKGKPKNLDTFFKVCTNTLREHYLAKRDIETIVRALTRIMQDHHRRDPLVACKVLTLCSAAWESIMDSDDAEIMAMQNALWAMRRFPSHPNVIAKAMAVISDFIPYALPSSGDDKKFVAFCAQGGVEVLMKIASKDHHYERKLARVFEEFYDEALDIVKYHEENEQEDESAMELEEDPFLVYCKIAVCRRRKRLDRVSRLAPASISKFL